MSGAIPVFIQPEVDMEFGIANSLSFQNIKDALKEHPDAKAVFIINPTYFGATPDLKSIIRYCHRHKVAVLVDEAHGSHLPFHHDLPDSAMNSGADMSTVSLHKTGGSLTQSSALLLNEGLIKKYQVNTIINIMQTTSASYLLMSSLDLARRNLALNGQQIFTKLLISIDHAKKEIAKIPGLSVLTREYINGAGIYDYDETKLVIRVNDLGLTGFEVYDILLNEYLVQTELAETYVVLAVVSIGDDDSTISKLVEALRDISRRFYGKKEKFTVRMSDFFEKPRTVIAPRDAFYSPKKIMPIDQSEGEICGESIMIYPPGIPLIIPGEKITAKVIEHYKFYLNQHCVVAHDEDDPLAIKVVGD
jgi:arginine/lysine/ornithine decarboxylase